MDGEGVGWLKLDDGTYHEMAISMAVDFVGDVQRPASIFRNDCFAFLGGFEVPYQVLVLWVLLEFFRGHGLVLCHYSSVALYSFTVDSEWSRTESVSRL